MAGFGSLVDQLMPPDSMTGATGAPSTSAGAQKLSSFLSGVKFERNGAIVGGSLVDMATFAEMVKRQAQQYGVSTADLPAVLKGAGIGFSMNGDKLAISGKGGAPAAPAAPGAPAAPTAPTSPTAPSGAGGGGGAGAIVGGGGSGGGGRTSAGLPWGSGDSRLQGSSGSAITIGGTGGAGTGATPFDPRAPLGLNPGPRSAVVGGAAPFRSNTFGSAGDPFAGIGPNSSAQDIAMALARKQDANQDAARQTYGGAYDAHQNDAVLQGARGLAGQLAANPFSLDDATKARISGRNTEAIGQRAGRLETAARERAATTGGLRSGATEDRVYSIQAGAARDATRGERDLDIEQATRRPAELQSALGAVGQFGMQDSNARTGISTGYADNVLGATSILGDALLTGPLLAGSQQPQATINGGMQSPGFKLSNWGLGG